jgi:predicted ATPase
MLKRLRDDELYKKHYKRIISTIQGVIPQLDDFELDPLPSDDSSVMLNWYDRARGDHLFGPDQLSDGSLRFIALTTLLLQPPALAPRLIIIDEPELGLHPAAIRALAAMIKSASKHSQVLIATQSPLLVDAFTPEQIVIVERDEAAGHTRFRRLDTDALHDWLEAYSLSELWEKNVLGGQP